jgi:hypothetical protein
MADPVSAAFQTTLLILYFVTPAVNIPQGQSKKAFETKAIWTLQSTSQIPLENSDICSQMGTKLINQFKHVYTITVRAYCLCPQGDGNKVCFNNQAQIATFAQQATHGEKSQPTIMLLGPEDR